MRRFSVTLTDELEDKFNDFQKRNKIKSQTKAVQECLKLVLNGSDYVTTVTEIESKLRTILYRQNVQKKLLEQFFANMGFPINEDIKKDKKLQEFYENNFNYKYGNMLD